MVIQLLRVSFFAQSWFYNYCAFSIPFLLRKEGILIAIMVIQLLRVSFFAQSWFYNYCWNFAFIIPYLRNASHGIQERIINAKFQQQLLLSLIPFLQNKGYQVVSLPLHGIQKGIIKYKSWERAYFFLRIFSFALFFYTHFAVKTKRIFCFGENAYFFARR